MGDGRGYNPILSILILYEEALAVCEVCILYIFNKYYISDVFYHSDSLL